jgi:hypothetical protein
MVTIHTTIAMMTDEIADMTTAVTGTGATEMAIGRTRRERQ